MKLWRVNPETLMEMLVKEQGGEKAMVCVVLRLECRKSDGFCIVLVC